MLLLSQAITAHTYDGGEYARKITCTVEFPGQAEIEVETNNQYASHVFTRKGDADYDYGLIFLPACGKACDDGFGWSVILQDEELNGRLVTNCGYPGDKPRGTMWMKVENSAATLTIRYLI